MSFFARLTSEIGFVSLRPEHCIFWASVISRLLLKRGSFCNLIQEAGLERLWGRSQVLGLLCSTRAVPWSGEVSKLLVRIYSKDKVYF